MVEPVYSDLINVVDPSSAVALDQQQMLINVACRVHDSVRLVRYA